MHRRPALAPPVLAIFKPARFVCLYLCAAIAAWPADSRSDPRIPTHFKMPEYRRSRNGRRAEALKQIQFWAGLDPMPERAPVRSEIFGRIENRDYSIEKVLVETREGYWLGGNLYRPLGRTGKFPGIVSPHGHWSYGRLEHTPTGSLPTRGINLARQGYVVFMYDMVGYNDPHADSARVRQ